MRLKSFVFAVLSVVVFSTSSNACSMYKITQDGKTIVGNNEDWFSPNSQFWFETGENDNYGVLYMGLLDRFAQGAINEAGLVFDGFANPELPVLHSEGKTQIPISEAIRVTMQTMSTVGEVKAYFETIDLSSFSSSMVVFVDRSGEYLIIEGDALILGKEDEKAFSNFYYSQVESENDVELDYFQAGWNYVKNTEGQPTLSYCSTVMSEMASRKTFGTQYTTIYDLQELTIRVYLFHDYNHPVDINLMDELAKGNHETMIADLMPKGSDGYGHYKKYNDSENPTGILEALLEGQENLTEDELTAMGFNDIVNMLGYEWLNDLANPKAAIRIFEFGTALTPNDADLFDSLGEAYFEDEDYQMAKASYEQSLTLNPDNENAKSFLTKIASKAKE